MYHRSKSALIAGYVLVVTRALPIDRWPQQNTPQHNKAGEAALVSSTLLKRSAPQGTRYSCSHGGKETERMPSQKSGAEGARRAREGRQIASGRSAARAMCGVACQRRRSGGSNAAPGHAGPADYKTQPSTSSLLLSLLSALSWRLALRSSLLFSALVLRLALSWLWLPACASRDVLAVPSAWCVWCLYLT